MSQNIGTLISAAIRPNDSNDLIASAFANEIKGGHHGYATLTERNSIIIQRREWGMFCTVYNDGTPSNNNTYQLTYNYSSTNIMDNANWVIFSSGGGSGTEWLSSVLSIESIEPAASNGDRYILGPSPTGTNWISLNAGDVVQYDSAISNWIVTQPSDGTSVRVDNEDNAIYRYEGIYPTGTWEKEKESQVRYLNISTLDGYSFSSTSYPSFNQYDTETVFISKFSGTNFGVTASLNINGLGEKPLKRTFGQSLTTLLPSDISLNYPYSLTYDGTQFILTKPPQDNVSFNVQYYLSPSDYVIVPPNTQYWVYGDITLDASNIDNYGQVIVTNGNIISGSAGYTFSNYNSLILNSFAEIDGLGQTNYLARWKTNYKLTATSSIWDDGNLVQVTGNTFSVLTNNIYIPNGASSSYVLTSDANGVATWQPAAGGVSKYSATQSFLAGVTYSITHGLNTNAIVTNFWDESNGELLIVNVTRTGLNTVDFNSAITVLNGRVVILG